MYQEIDISTSYVQITVSDKLNYVPGNSVVVVGQNDNGYSFQGYVDIYDGITGNLTIRDIQHVKPSGTIIFPSQLYNVNLHGIDGSAGITGYTGPNALDGDKYSTTTLLYEEIDVSTGYVQINVADKLAYIQGNSIIVIGQNDPDYSFQGYIHTYDGVTGNLVIRDIQNVKPNGTIIFPSQLYNVNVNGIDGSKGQKGDTGPMGMDGDKYKTTTLLYENIDVSAGYVQISVADKLAYIQGNSIVVVGQNDPDYSFQGYIHTYDGITGNLVIRDIQNVKPGGTIIFPSQLYNVNVNGIDGPAGPTGAMGVAGATGPMGPAGIAAVNGATGPTGHGSTGSTGSTGPTGQGPTGPTGPAAENGSTGPTGQGSTGPTGIAGPTGPGGGGGISQNDLTLFSQSTNPTYKWDYYINASGSINGSSSVSMSSSGQYQTAVGSQIVVSSDYGATFGATGPSGSFTGISLSGSGKYQTAIGTNIYTSSNFGSSWSTVTLADTAFTGIGVSSTGQYQVAVFNGGIYLSTNFGVTWTKNATVTGNFTSVAISGSGQYLNAVTQSGFIHTSTNYGVAWSSTSTAYNFVSVGMSSNGQYHAIVTSTTTIYLSTDFGTTWTSISIPVSFSKISISSSGQYQITLSSTGVYYSTDYGNKWAKLFPINSYNSVTISSSGQYITCPLFNAIHVFNGLATPFRKSPLQSLISDTITGTTTNQTIPSLSNIIGVSSSSYGVAIFNEASTYVYYNNVWTLGPIPIVDGTYQNDDSTFVAPIIKNVKIVGDLLVSYSANNIFAAILTPSFTSMQSQSIGTDSNYQAVYNFFRSNGYSAQFSDALASVGYKTYGIAFQKSSISVTNLNCLAFCIKKSFNSSFNMETIGFNKITTIDSSFTVKTYGKDINGDIILEKTVALSANNNLQGDIEMSSSGQYIVCAAYGGLLYVSSDTGTTFTASSSTTRNYVKVAVSSSGRYMCAAVIGGYLYVSNDYGATWTEKSVSQNYKSVSISENGSYQVACTTNGSIYVSVNFGSNWSLTNTSGNVYNMSSNLTTSQYFLSTSTSLNKLELVTAPATYDTTSIKFNNSTNFASTNNWEITDNGTSSFYIKNDTQSLLTADNTKTSIHFNNTTNSTDNWQITADKTASNFYVKNDIDTLISVIGPTGPRGTAPSTVTMSFNLGTGPTGNNGDKPWVLTNNGEKDRVYFSNGTVSNYLSGSTAYWNSLSDRRIKNTITPIQSALPVLQQLNPVTYYMNKDSENHLHSGFIAQELQTVLPHVVSNSGLNYTEDKTDNNPLLGIDQTYLISYLVRGVQEQQKMISELQKQVSYLQAFVSRPQFPFNPTTTTGPSMPVNCGPSGPLCDSASMLPMTSKNGPTGPNIPF